jgi:hypothetical protein
MYEIGFDKLQPGQLYYIESRSGDRKVKHTGIFKKYSQLFEGSQYVAEFANVKNTKNSRSRVSEEPGDGLRNRSWIFMIPEKDAIYKRRDNRTLKMVMENIIGDQWFIPDIEI